MYVIEANCFAGERQPKETVKVESGGVGCKVKYSRDPAAVEGQR